ncbi:MAG: endopeptidase La [Gemmatimonadales bacterium]|nr:endopeptidase La [Gemmatimonadales bacterium]NCG32246.1 endopeptidase La [Pseudomonadota bacterium]MBT3498734.1 endopeptidase La [Gemmatimonadales bacterium]MBT3773843.1 endopeptidase La [Gemmatimonadales bacterium]MBT3959727.1 endopeptidase La [Gemmatimonadales bacterium]
MGERFTLPVLPLRDTVVYPGVAVPISAGRPGTVEAVQAALDGDRRMFAVAQRENVDDPLPEYLYNVGTVVRIIQTHRVRGGVQLLVQGEGRAQALSYHDEGESMMHAVLLDMESQEPRNEADPAFQALDRELRDRAAELGTRRGVPAEALNQLIQGVDEPGPFADLVAFYLELETSDKQDLLETLDDEDRMRSCLVAVERELARIDAQEDIQAKVQTELGERQREMLLREQLKAIQKELGEEEERDDVEEMRTRIAELDLSEEQRTEVDRELRRLERTSAQSAEYQVIRTFLEWVTELPWSERTEEKIDLSKAQQILEDDHHGLEDVKDRIVEFLAVRKLQLDRAEEAEKGASGNDAAGSEPHSGRGPILLFVGPPGVGKTSIAQSIARSLGRKYVRISLGGARDEADIRGHRRTYVGAMPGRIIQGMRSAKSKNPVFLLDEVDKLGVSFQGDPSSALLEVLDPAQNSTFVDHYLGIPFDLSEVLFIATANYLDRIPGPLLDRMERVDFAGYTEREKLQIAKKYLLPRQLKENSLTAGELQMTDKAVLSVVQKYTRESGVRQLEREVGKFARKVARKIAAGTMKKIKATGDDVRDLLGRPRVHPETLAAEDVVGVATGMFYTPMGGDIMFVEASVMPGEGTGGFLLTGQLGDVMKESGRAALSYTKAHWEGLGIPEESLKGREIHIHVPAGAIPKDGPSAGVTMATALVSAVSGRKVRRDVSMTGELTLTGRVLPIGGVKEKVLGAVRAGIKQIIVPIDNEADLDDIPDEVRKKITFHLAETLDDVLAVALRGGLKKPAAKKELAKKAAPKKKAAAKKKASGGTVRA